MSSDVKWKVIKVPGHDLENRLQQLTDDDYEIVSLDRRGTEWNIIARTSARQSKKGTPIGFRAPEKQTKAD